MRLTSSEIPNSEYLISNSKNNNEFIINTIDSSLNTNSTYKINIPDGNWNANDMTTYINNYFDHSIGDLRYLHFNIDIHSSKTNFRFKTVSEINAYLIDYPNSNLDIKNLENLSYALIDISSNNICYENRDYPKTFLTSILGFKPNPSATDKYTDYQIGVYVNKDNIYAYGKSVYQGYLQSPKIYSENINKYYFIYVNDFNTNTKEQVISCLNDNYIGDNIIARVQLVNPTFTINIDNNNDNVFKSRNYFRNVTIKKLHIKILDKYGRVVDLNDSNVSLALELTQKYSSCTL